jgi:hypothetical protein
MATGPKLDDTDAAINGSTLQSRGRVDPRGFSEPFPIPGFLYDEISLNLQLNGRDAVAQQPLDTR